MAHLSYQRALSRVIGKCLLFVTHHCNQAQHEVLSKLTSLSHKIISSNAYSNHNHDHITVNRKLQTDEFNWTEPILKREEQDLWPLWELNLAHRQNLSFARATTQMVASVSRFSTFAMARLIVPARTIRLSTRIASCAWLLRDHRLMRQPTSWKHSWRIMVHSTLLNYLDRK